MNSENLLSSVWPEWKIVGLIGRGSYGSVYKAVREEFSIKSFSAIKIISVPQYDTEIQELRTEGYDSDAINKYYQKKTSQLVKEVECLIALKNSTNIVKIIDYKVIDKDIGCTIYLRMELLIPFNEYLYKNGMSHTEILKLGMDICNALECCHKHNIVHRDIKPDNILVSEHGDFKLCDFGIARKLENSIATIKHRGVFLYAAPEVFEDKKYDIRADIYSLGLILYKLLNNNRFPFNDPNSEQYGAMTEYNRRRLSGEKFPILVDTDEKMSEVILRACEPNPDKRFQTPTEFGDALKALKIQNNAELTNNEDNEKTLIANQIMFEEKTVKNKTLLIIGIMIISVLFLGGISWGIMNIIFSDNSNMESNALSNNDEEVTEKITDTIADGTEEPSTEKATIEEETTEETTTEEATTEEATTEEETTEETTTEKATEETTTEEATEETTTEEAIEETTTEEATTEEATTEEATTEEATTEEATTEETTMEEVTTEEVSLYTVPSNCAYYDASSDKVYSAGSSINIIPEIGDELRTEDYVYIYDNMEKIYDTFEYESNLTYTWRVTVKDKSKTSYGEIMETIAGEKVESMYATFEECFNLKIAPEIPNTVSDLCFTFYKCESLMVLPKFPNSINELNRTFYGCASLKEISEIPLNIISLKYAFAGCISLNYIEKLHDGIENMNGTFRDCYALEKVEKLPAKVKYLNETFSGCINLNSVPEIQYGVETMRYTFSGCTSLTGDIIINANPKEYYACFRNTHNINIKGSSDILAELEATKWQ